MPDRLEALMSACITSIYSDTTLVPTRSITVSVLTVTILKNVKSRYKPATIKETASSLPD